MTGLEVVALVGAGYVIGALSTMFAIGLCLGASVEEDDRG